VAGVPFNFLSSHYCKALFSLSGDDNVNLMEQCCPVHALKVNVNNKAVRVYHCSTCGEHKTVSVDMNVGSEFNLQ
jgi:hypothetical protein